jgi:PTH1 family peptidyl-tRNA hydrolase
LDCQLADEVLILARSAPKEKEVMQENTSHSQYLIAGLGNPGRRFRKDRHNIGFMVLDHLTKPLALKFTKKQLKALVTEGRIADKKIILAKPQTYMNNVGRSIAPLLRYYKIPPENLLVIFDDLDLPVGTIRIRPQGGSGGHRGMRSIIQELGENGFPRMRIGIGRPPGRMDPADFVLQKFSKEEIELVNIVLEKAVESIHVFIREGIEHAMTRYNTQI